MYVFAYVYTKHAQPVALGVWLILSQMSFDDRFVWVSFATFHGKETNKTEIGD